MKKILQLAALALILAAGLTPARSITLPPHCGDSCSPNGATSGCIDVTGPVIKRAICTCTSGRWTC
jgi:hypothetical protein